MSRNNPKFEIITEQLNGIDFLMKKGRIIYALFFESQERIKTDTLSLWSQIILHVRF